jgi:hypothetical protein
LLLLSLVQISTAIASCCIFELPVCGPTPGVLNVQFEFLSLSVSRSGVE